MLRKRPSLLWLLGPVVLYLVALPFVNRIEPIVFGLPFFVFWMLLATVLTPVSIWLAARRDPVWRAEQAEQAEHRQHGKGGDR